MSFMRLCCVCCRFLWRNVWRSSKNICSELNVVKKGLAKKAKFYSRGGGRFGPTLCIMTRLRLGLSVRWISIFSA